MQVCLLQKEAYQRLTPKLKFAIHWLPSISGCDRQNATKGSICQFYFNPCLCKLGQKLVFTGSDRELTCYSSMSCWATLSNKNTSWALSFLHYHQLFNSPQIQKSHSCQYCVCSNFIVSVRFIKRFVSHLTQWSPLPSFKKKTKMGMLKRTLKLLLHTNLVRSTWF